MKHIRKLLMVFAVLSLGTIAESSEPAADEKPGAKLIASSHSETIDLFNGKNFEGWHMYVKGDEVDPKDVWEVRDGAIWCKGEPFGFIRTTKKYSDFKLVLEWKWPEKPTNSGVLLRMQEGNKIWPKCMEAQLKYERAGDVVGMGCDFNENQSDEGEFFRYAPRKHDSNETKPGNWNTYEIVCKGDTMELTVNGQFQNLATGVCVEKGYVGLQSEGSPIMFRNIKLTPLK